MKSSRVMPTVLPFISFIEEVNQNRLRHSKKNILITKAKVKQMVSFVKMPYLDCISYLSLTQYAILLEPQPTPTKSGTPSKRNKPTKVREPVKKTPDDPVCKKLLCFHVSLLAVSNTFYSHLLLSLIDIITFQGD